MKSYMVILASLALAACQSTTGAPLQASAVNQIHEGSSTKADVKKLLGEPENQMLQGDDQDYWIYSRSKMDSNAGAGTAGFMALYAGAAVLGSVTPLGSAALAIPAVGGAAINSNTQSKNTSYNLMVVFRGNIVSSCRLQTMSSTYRPGIMIFTPMSISQNSKEVRCTDVGKGSTD